LSKKIVAKWLCKYHFSCKSPKETKVYVVRVEKVVLSIMMA